MWVTWIGQHGGRCRGWRHKECARQAVLFWQCCENGSHAAVEASEASNAARLQASMVLAACGHLAWLPGAAAGVPSKCNMVLGLSCQEVLCDVAEDPPCLMGVVCIDGALEPEL